MAVRIVKNHFWLWLKADSLMWTVATSERGRERAANPASSLLKTASLHFHIYPLQKSYQHLLCTCCQAITHIYLYSFNSPLNCILKKNHFESAYSMEEKGNFSLILFYILQKWAAFYFLRYFNIYFICGHSWTVHTTHISTILCGLPSVVSSTDFISYILTDTSTAYVAYTENSKCCCGWNWFQQLLSLTV